MNHEIRKPSSTGIKRGAQNAIRVQFVPPEDKTLEQFTQRVCDVLVKKGRNEFASQNIRWNITNFLKLVAELTTKQLNKDQENAQREGKVSNAR